MPLTAKTVVVQNYMTKGVDLSDSPSATFAVKIIPIVSPLPDDHLLLRTLYISNDPGHSIYVRRMASNTNRMSVVPIPIGDPMGAFTVSRVVEVSSIAADGLVKVGDIVEAYTCWADYVVVPKGSVNVIK